TVAVSIAVQGNLMAIEISDSGCGMSPEFIQSRLFKPFDTTKGKAGMGIGVYESLHVVNSMGGRLTVDSQLGSGTTVRISLPIGESHDRELKWGRFGATA